jgi:hypothetical protein
MQSKIHQNPDGSITVSGERYRVDDRSPGQFDVVRERDGLHMGAFHLQPDVRVEAPSEHLEIVQAVARLLATPRGLLPLQ